MWSSIASIILFSIGVRNGAVAYSKKERNLDTTNLIQALDEVKNEIDNKLFLYLTPDYQWIPSTVYRYDDFLESLKIMSEIGVAGKLFYTGENVDNGHVYGLINIAAFLAQSMKETIQYDACDENSWDLIGGKYPLSNACGQLGQSYQDYHCSDEEKHMECPVDPNMSITAVTHAKWYGAPGPLFCGPKSEYSFTGIWDHLYECNRPWANPPEMCSVYEGQKAGRYDNSAPYANNAGRTDVEGCCWWGRGVIQTSGVCNFGKLNYYLGARAAADGRDSRYPTIDFCKDPEVICSSAEYKELKWIAGMFYWMESVQTYNVDGWDYLTELRSFVEGGMTGTSFIDAVSGIVNRGCHNPPCGTGELDGRMERSDNFNKVLDAFFGGVVPQVTAPITVSDTPDTSDSLTESNPSSAVSTPIPTRQPVSPSSEAGLVLNSDTFVNLAKALDDSKGDIDSKLFLYLTPDYQWIPSSVYRYDDFFESVRIMASEGVAGKRLYIGDDVEDGHIFGLVNIAAFLAQSMKETIQYDACDENSWDLIGGKYPLSNACGQLGQSYQDYHCSDEEKHMECPVDPNMSITAVTHAKWYGAPGPLFCGPKTEYSFTGIWDHLYECNRPWANPPETCSVYEGQKAGRYDNSAPYANNAGRTDVEGCCWWGRGVIQTSGVCNFGKLNYYLGARAAADGRDSRYPTIDFCKDPEVICSSAEYKELKWIAGMFYWMESVQTYNVDGWDYLTELRSFVEGGMTGTSFIDAVSGIVNRGCHNPPCGTGVVDGGWERSENFQKVLSVFFNGAPPTLGPFESIEIIDDEISSNSTDFDLEIDVSGLVETTFPPQPSQPLPQPLPQPQPKPQNVVVYKCEGTIDIPPNSPIIDILFDYEVFMLSNVQAAHLLPELKEKIMEDLAASFGCDVSFGRNLRAGQENYLLGFQYIEDGDVIDGQKALCDDSGIEDPSLQCVPVIGHVAGFFKSDTPTKIVEETKSEILDNIEHGMEESRYSTNFVQRVVFVSEREYETQSKLDSADHGTSLSSSTFSPGESSSSTPVWVPVICTLLAIAIIASGFALIVRKRMNKIVHEPNNFEDHRDSDKAELDCTFDAGLSGHRDTSDGDDYNGRDSASCCQDICGDSFETNSSTHFESDEGWASPLSRNPVKSTTSGKAGLHCSKYNSADLFSESSSDTNIGPQIANEGHSFDMDPKSYDQSTTDYQGNDGVNFVLVESGSASPYMHSFNHNNRFVCNDYASDENNNEGSNEVQSEASFEGRSSAHRQIKNDTDFDSSINYPESDENQVGTDHGALTGRNHHYSRANNIIFDQPSGESAASSVGAQYVGKKLSSVFFETNDATGETFINNGWKDRNVGKDDIEEESDGDETFDC